MSSAGNQTEQAAAEAIVDLATQSIMQSETEISTTPAQAEDMMDASAEAILESDESGQGQLQISAQQLHQLSSGDYIEINGETYKVAIYMRECYCNWLHLDFQSILLELYY